MDSNFVRLLQSLRDDHESLTPEMQRKSLYFQSFFRRFNETNIEDVLSEEQVNSIQKLKYKKNDKKISSDECSICLENFKTNQVVKLLECKHCFHPECLDTWVKKHGLCPYCKCIIK